VLPSFEGLLGKMICNTTMQDATTDDCNSKGKEQQRPSSLTDQNNIRIINSDNAGMPISLPHSTTEASSSSCHCPVSLRVVGTVSEEADDMTCQFINTDHLPTVQNMEDDLNITTTTAAATTVHDEATSTVTTTTTTHDDEIQIGDHVYQWRHLLGIPCVFQHHGIVMDVIQDHQGKTIKLTIADFSNVETKRRHHRKKNKENKLICHQNTQNQESTLTSASTDSQSVSLSSQSSQCLEQSQQNPGHTIETLSTNPKRRLSLAQEGIVRAYTDTDKWHRVHYEAPWWKRQVYRSGTATKAKSDPVGMVLARVNFILQHPE
jgi:hypothetical protein